MQLADDEEIKPVQGFNGYFITSKGRLLTDIPTSCTNRQFMTEGYTPDEELHEVKTNINDGYKAVNMKSETGVKSRFIHQLVGNEFVPNPHHYRCLTHIDRDKMNNSADNLKWASNYVVNRNSPDRSLTEDD